MIAGAKGHLFFFHVRSRVCDSYIAEYVCGVRVAHAIK